MEESLKILVIDDDDVDRIAISRNLKKAIQGVQIQESTDGVLGIEALKSRAFDCVFLDYRLPGADGLDILRKLRGDGIKTPIIMLTGQGDEQIAVEMMKSGASDYLTKDKMSPDTLSKSVRYVIKACKTEEDLRESEERYTVAVRGAKDGIWDWDLKINRIYFSPRWKSMIGCEEDQVGSAPEEWFNRVHPEDLDRVKTEISGHLEGRTSHYENEHRMLHRDGKYRWMLSRGLAVRDQGGKASRIAGSQTDITERKHSEQERERLYQQALEADRRKDEFLAMVSHELRTPLTSIIGWIELLRMGNLSQSNVARAFEIIEKNAKLKARLVEDLLDVSRIVKGNVQVNVRPVKLLSVIEATMESVRAAVKAKSLQILSTVDGFAAPILGDPDRLQQIVWNLLSNAIKFTPVGGRVEIRLEQIESNVTLTVSDSGCGISPEFLPYVFDRFRQAENPDTRSYQGLGLGLAIVRHLVELHGGTIAAASDGPGRGSTFKATFPGIAVETRTELLWEPLPSHEAIPILEGLEVLIVDDDADTLEVLVSVLQQYGATVRAAASAAEALGLLRVYWPNVLISDIAMPREDGYSLIRNVRALELEQGKHVPSIALTAYASSEDRTRALSAGFHAHVPKPIEPAKLAAVVAEITGRVRQ